MVKAITLQAVAQELAEAFETRTRSDSNPFVCLKDEAHGTWIQKAIQDAHEEEMPNDSIYAMCEQVAEAISEEIADAVDWEDMSEIELHERLDSLVPVYTHELKQWLLDNPNADASIETGIEAGVIVTDQDGFSLFRVLSGGYYYQLDAIAGTLCNAIQAQYESLKAIERRETDGSESN